ncbi:CHRD domain-containing protein [Leptolyngbya sp. AN03gr2]|uniref:CHRD domain-containing protein n=1 Tax=unclassified Leptolyngbya TaxID=2650499 RepID=UPI003D321E81
MATDATHFDHTAGNNSSEIAVSTIATTSTHDSHQSTSQGSSIQASDTTAQLETTVGADANHNHEKPADAPDFQHTNDGQMQALEGTLNRDRLIGGSENTFLYAGDDSFSFDTVTGTGPGEFPFPNDSPGTSQLDLELQDGTLSVNGTFQDFQGKPLFSDGVQDLAPDAVIPNGADPKQLIENFKKVPQDDEGNPLSGFHAHFGQEGTADATVEKYFTVEPNADGKSGSVSAQFELNPETQAALLANNLYINEHSTIHPVGEVRVELDTAQAV